MMKRLLLSSMLLTCVTLAVVIMTTRAPVTPQAAPTPPAATAKRSMPTKSAISPFCAGTSLLK